VRPHLGGGHRGHRLWWSFSPYSSPVSTRKLPHQRLTGRGPLVPTLLGGGGCARGRSLAQRLVSDGEHVVDVPAKLAARVRVLSVGHGRKSDPHDAVSVAVAAQSAPQLRQVSIEDQAAVLQLLTKRRQDLVDRQS
jgi:Transposase